MSASAQGSTATTKATVDNSNGSENKDQKKQTAQLEEDDEFEDFPAEGKLNFFEDGDSSGLDPDYTPRMGRRRHRAPKRKPTSVGGELGRR
jgi:hypothetical protein